MLVGDTGPAGAVGAAGRDSVPSTPLPAAAAAATPGPVERHGSAHNGRTPPSRAAPGDGPDPYDASKQAARCFLPLLHPTPNWAASNCECAERYRFMFHPAACSALR